MRGLVTTFYVVLCASELIGWGARSAAADDDLAPLIERVEKSVVRINVKKTDGGGTGSGFLVSESTVVTNYHVIDGAVGAEAEFSDGALARVRGYLAIDPARDVAIVRIDKIERDNLPLLEGMPHKGEHVVAIGAPLGLSFTASDGIVSAVRSNEEYEAEMGGSVGCKGMVWIQTTAPISPGNSGGPLVNKKGEVVGINTQTIIIGQNLNFAVSAKDIKTVLETAKDSPLSFANLPRKARPIRRKEENAPGPGVTLPGVFKLPSGKVLDIESAFLGPFRKQTLLLRENRSDPDKFLVKFKHSNGTVAGVVTVKQAALDGMAVALYENGEPATIANYLDGSLHENLMTWNEEGQGVLFAQYFKGKENGLVCLFDNGKLLLVQEATNGKITAKHHFDGSKLVRSYSATDEADSALESAQAKLEEVKRKLNEAQAKVKKAVREAAKDRRQAIASATSVQKRNAVMEQAARLEAADRAIIDSLQRRSMYGRP